MILAAVHSAAFPPPLAFLSYSLGKNMRPFTLASTPLFATPWLSLFVWTILSHGHEALLFAQTQPLHASKPNIVLIITDDQGYPPIGRLGHPWIQTPNLDELHDRSVRFDRFLVSPTCAPTRSALMTGRHPMRNGITHTILERERLALDATTLPQVLKTAGYRSGIFGKWHLGDEDAYQPQQRGFDEAFIHGGGGIGQAYDCSCADAPGNRYFDPVIRHNGKFVKTHGFCTDVFFDAAMRWIGGEQAGDQPFFAYIATNAPHAPHFAPEANLKRFTDLGFNKEAAGYYGMIENIDQNVGRLMQYMDKHDLFKNTIVLFMSDNGMAPIGPQPLKTVIGKDEQGQPMIQTNAGMKGFKNSVEEGGVRVPLFVRWDGRIQPGRNLPQVIAHLDILPTLADLAGVDLNDPEVMPPKQVEGRSFLGMLTGEEVAWPDRLLMEHVGRWPTGAEPNDHQWKNFAVRSHRFRLVGREQLFDMVNDPGQTRNCLAEHPEEAAKMIEAYDRWWQTTRPLMVNETVPMSTVKPFHEAFYEQQKTVGIPDWK